MRRNRQFRGPHALGRIVVVVLAVAATAVAYVAILPRILRRNRHLLRLGVAKRYNDLTRKTSGTRGSPFALLTHAGRRSGHTYQTSLGACAQGDGFLLPLAYGRQTDWYRNVMAAGSCQLAWKGHTYQLDRPEIVSGPEIIRAWPARQRITLRLSGIHDFLWLHEQAQ